MYNTALEASYDARAAASWERASTILSRLLAEAGPDALEGDSRVRFAERAFTLLRPLMADTITQSRTHASRQLRAMGVKGAVAPDLTDITLTQGDVYNLLAASARYFFATGNRKDYTDPAVKADAFRYAVQLAGRQAITLLSERRLEAASRTYENGGIRIYERYLGSGDHCDLCKQIAGTRVTRQDIKPVHDRCTCGVRPLRTR